MKLCIDVNDKYEELFNRLNDKQKERLLKGLSAYSNAILSILNSMSGEALNNALNMVTSAMFLLSVVSGEGAENENEGEND
jgi:hypothetical protein